MNDGTITNARAQKELEALRKKVSELESLVEEGKRTQERLRRSEAEWKLVDEALKESEEKFRSVIQASPMGVHMYLLNADGRLVFAGANPAADAILGVDNTQFIGKTIEEAFPPLADTEVPERYRRAAADGKPWNTSQVNYKDERIAGAYEVYAFQTSPGRMAAMFFDITDRLRAEEALRESERQHRTLFETMAQGVVYQDSEGHIITANSAAENILGLTLDQMLGRTSMDPRWRAVHEDGADFPGDTHPAMLVLRTGAPQHAIMGVFNPTDEGYRWIDVYATPEFTEGEVAPHRVFTTFTDITERRQAEGQRLQLEEQLRQALKMEAIGRLAGGIAHDFNNLLTAVGGYSDLILQALPANHELRNDVNEIRKASDRASALTQQLLAFSRKQIISPEILDLNSCIEAAHMMLSRLIGEDIELRLELQDEPGTVEADPIQIDQIIINLAVNARDSMPDGGLLVISTENVVLDDEFCQANPDADPGEFVMLSVRDSGRGMDSETLSRVFEPFFTTKEQGKGTGLGLATVFGIVQQNRGVVKVHSEPGAGTTVKIYLPSAAERVKPAARPNPPGSQTGTETILLAEDETAVRALAEKFLTKRGYKVLTADSAVDTVELCRAHVGDIDLLLTDVVMPGMNGRELYQKLNRIRPKLKVLYMSGYTGDIIDKHGMLEKDTAYVQKPFTIEVLARKVREALNREF